MVSLVSSLGSPLPASPLSRGPPAPACFPASSPLSPAAPPNPFSLEASNPLLPMPAEFFHPAVSAGQQGQEQGAGAGALPKIALQGSWASLRSPSVTCTLLRQVWRPLAPLRGPSEWGLGVPGRGGGAGLAGGQSRRAGPPELDWPGLPPGHTEGLVAELGLGPGLLRAFVHSVVVDPSRVPGCASVCVPGSEAAAATECRIPAPAAYGLCVVCVWQGCERRADNPE